MRSLIVEDEFTSRNQLKFFLEEYGPCDVAMNGLEALQGFELGHKGGTPYQLICLDINMPEMDGHELLERIREFEDKLGLPSTRRAKIFMTTALADPKNIMKAYRELCDEYLAKPIDNEKLSALLKTHNLV